MSRFASWFTTLKPQVADWPSLQSSGILAPLNNGAAQHEEMTLAEAADYLDWLEVHGQASKEVVMLENGKVAVR